MSHTASDSLSTRLEKLVELSVSLSAERNLDKLLENILLAARQFTKADGGTLYRLENDTLQFAIIRNDTLNIALGGTTQKPIPFTPLNLYIDGKPNLNQVATCVALNRTTINVDDAYTTEEYDFSGTKRFDSATGYRSRAFLTIPMTDHDDEIIGVLQLINPQTEIGKFTDEDRKIVEALTSIAAVALNNRLLIIQLQTLLEALIGMINIAIDEKSSHTSQHCLRVPELVMMLAEATHNIQEGPLASFTMTDKDRYELKIAGLMHDCGKLTTPDHIINKATKLEKIHDRIEEVAARFTALRAQTEVNMLRALQQTGDDPAEKQRLEQACAAELQTLDDDLAFLRLSNKGGEFMGDEAKARIQHIAQRVWINSAGEAQPLLSADEVHHLSISRGTLTAEDRAIINHHIVATERMLNALPWPRHLQNVTEYAVNHHERMDGKGYPKGLKRDEMSLPSRMMSIADVFEALTSRDRPYKTPRTLRESLSILQKMSQEGHIDPELFDVFLHQQVWLEYARKRLEPEQIDMESAEEL